MPRFEMVISSRDYYSDEGSWVFRLPETVATKDEAFKWIRAHLKDILEPTAGRSRWISKNFFRYDRGHCEGNATYEVDVNEIPAVEDKWPDFIAAWNEAHPNNRPDDWTGLW